MNLKQNQSKLIHSLKKIWIFIKPEKRNLIGYTIISITEAVLSIILPLFSAKIILNITDGFFEQLILSAGVVFIIQLMFSTTNYFKGYFYQQIHRGTMNRMQIKVAEEILKLEVKEVDKASSGLFIERLNNDTAEISRIFMEISYWITNVLSKIGILITIFILNKYIFLFSVVVATISFFINKKKLNKQYEMQKKVRKLRESKTSIISELVRGIRDVKVLNAEEQSLKETSKRIYDVSDQNFKAQNSSRKYSYLDNCSKNISSFLFILLGSFLSINGLLTIPNFVILYNYQSYVNNLLIGVVSLMEYLKKFMLSAERIFEIIEDDTFKKEAFGKKHIKKINGDIAFEKVSFGYDKDKMVLKEIDFKINANETVAFVGKSGAGKTTILNLITKLYNCEEGKITFDGIDIKELDKHSLRDNISIITQSPYIFNFSIKENMRLASPNATLEEIRNACRLACLDDYIMSLDMQYETVLGEGGLVLSGGQKQRLAIARALLMKTEIILLDEATSALDNETQSLIQEAIHNLKGEYTILIVAHRLSTIINSDRIIVIDDGKVIKEGTHQELLENCEFYKNLYATESSID